MEQLQLIDFGRSPEPDSTQSPQTEPQPVRARTAPSIPPEVIVAAVELMGAIDLDPYCLNESTTLVPAKLHYGIDANALATPWGPQRRRIFLAPPAGRATGAWINKLCDEYEAGNISQGVAYLRAALDSEWWKRLIPYPVCIVDRRLRLLAGTTSTRVPWAAVYLGKNIRGFAEAFGEIGALYMPYKRPAAPAQPAAAKKRARADREPLKEQAAGGSQTIQQGNYVLTVHPSASFLTLANPHWDTRDRNHLRQAVLNIPGILPSQYSGISKSQDGTIKLVFSFNKDQAEKVVSRIRKLLAGPGYGAQP